MSVKYGGDDCRRRSDPIFFKHFFEYLFFLNAIVLNTLACLVLINIAVLKTIAFLPCFVSIVRISTLDIFFPLNGEKTVSLSQHARADNPVTLTPTRSSPSQFG